MLITYTISAVVAENGLVMYLWVGQQSSQEWLQKALGAPDFARIDTPMVGELTNLLHA